MYGFDTVIARLFAFVGPLFPLDENFAAGNFIRDALAGGPVQIDGDGTPYRSYLYAADLAIWLWTLLMLGERGTAYNVGSPDAVSIADLARRVVEVAAPRAEIRIAHAAIPGVPAARYIPATDRAPPSACSPGSRSKKRSAALANGIGGTRCSLPIFS